ncbi:T-cell surface antigen CD2-like [Mobula birostris]|uniref:T-cell surface antigen CD2-like n=1 Tax=Mobula birostris TaxID=1983395 RepID=UPI003B28177F
MIWYRKYLRQLNLFFLLAASGVFPTASNENAEIVYSELGKSAFLQSPDLISLKANEVRWNKGNILVARYKNGSKAYGNFLGRVEVLLNGTLKFITTTSSDEATYSCEIFNEQGLKQDGCTFKLSLLEKVSDPVLNISCNSPEEINITCSVENGTKINITLHSDSLTETVQGHHLERRFSFKKTGNKTYICIAKNKISEAQTVKVNHCADNGTPNSYIKILLIAGIIAGAMIISFVLLCLIWKSCRSRRQGQRAKPLPSQGERKEITESNFVNQSMPPTIPAREHPENSKPYPQTKSRPAQEFGERMDEKQRARRAERTDGGRRGLREDRSPKAGIAPREKAYQGGTAQRGGRAPRNETLERRGGRGPLPIPPQ